MSNENGEISSPQDKIMNLFFERLSKDKRVNPDIVANLIALNESGAFSSRSSLAEILRNQVFNNENNPS